MADQKPRYIPPNEKGRGGKGKKPGGRTGGQQNKDSEKSQPVDAGSQMKRVPQQIVTLENCSESEVIQLMKDRWAAAMEQYNDPKEDLSRRPIIYYAGNVWGRLPHEIQASANNTRRPTMSPADYVTEVRKGLLAPKPSSGSNN